MRTLYYVPMIHSPDELGSLRESVLQTHAKIYGNDRLEKLLEKIAEFWDEIGKRMIAAELYSPVASSLHVFVDGLPNVDENIVRKVVEDLIESRTIPLYQIIAKLQKNGARVHGTEDTELLLKEFEYYKGLSEGKNPNPVESQERLKARDTAITLRIQEIMTQDDDIGILFVGMLHDVISKLPDEFNVICL